MLAARAVIVMAFGLALAYFHPGVEIILAYYGAMFLLAPAGSMTLTLYSGHLLFLAGGLLGASPFESFGLQVCAAVLFGVLWRNLVGRGPLEAAVSAVSTRVRNAAAGEETRRQEEQAARRPGSAVPSGS